MTVQYWVYFFLAVSVLSLFVAFLFARQVIGSDKGTPAMQQIAAAIKEGAEAFLKRQYRTIYALSVVLAILIYALYLFLGKTEHHLAEKTVISFFAGAICSGLAGFSGMFVSIRANLRAASAARSSLNGALKIALRGGAVTGLSVVALSLLGVGIIFLAFPAKEARLIYLGVASGMHLGDRQAFFIDIGGGSTEISVGGQHQFQELESFRLGAIRGPTNMFFSESPSGPGTANHTGSSSNM